MIQRERLTFDLIVSPPLFLLSIQRMSRSVDIVNPMGVR